ncbi:hypothetical protein WS66_01915 [Burkholderia sp. LA-2-3-30-S1-D2]|nr:hypothetical protein WS66_01915 [Burkholderia sp. LA-2-3-30-S1-D2]KVE20979.1 hypothetical protein WS66_25740 [Burkholderia sp. LA-2-3-30-S1-D2]
MSRGCITTDVGIMIRRRRGISAWIQLAYEAGSIYTHTAKVILSRESIRSVFRRGGQFSLGWDIYTKLMRHHRDLRLLTILKQDFY